MDHPPKKKKDKKITKKKKEILFRTGRMRKRENVGHANAFFGGEKSGKKKMEKETLMFCCCCCCCCFFLKIFFLSCRRRPRKPLRFPFSFLFLGLFLRKKNLFFKVFFFLIPTEKKRREIEMKKIVLELSQPAAVFPSFIFFWRFFVVFPAKITFVFCFSGKK